MIQDVFNVVSTVTAILLLALWTKSDVVNFALRVLFAVMAVMGALLLGFRYGLIGVAV